MLNSIIVLLLSLFSIDLIGQDTIIEQKFNSKGELIREIKTLNNEKIIIDYYEDGAPYSVCPYVDGVIHGLYKSYYDNGNIKAEIYFNKGCKHGIAKFYYLDGTIHSYIEYEHNQYHGEYKTYNREGLLTNVFLYVNGRKVE